MDDRASLVTRRQGVEQLLDDPGLSPTERTQLQAERLAIKSHPAHFAEAYADDPDALTAAPPAVDEAAARDLLDRYRAR